MEGDGEIQPDDVRAGSHQPGHRGGDGHRGIMGHHKADGDRNNNDDDDDDSEEEEEEEEDDEEEDDSDEGDTPDGGPPTTQQHIEELTSPTEMMKRVPIQSRRMQEYQAMQQFNSNSGKIWRCPEQSCSKVFHSAPGFRYHMQSHSRQAKDSFCCEVCLKPFKSSNGLKYHRKRKRCRGVEGVASVASSSFPSASTSSTVGLTMGSSNQAPRLLELANIATGPQSPLLQTVGGEARRAFFDESETSAAIALSSMAQKSRGVRGFRSSRYHTLTAGDPDWPSSHHQAVSQDEEQDRNKSKRPMNGFMLFAQKNRADFNKKFPETNNRMISTKLSEAWKLLPDVERNHWKAEAAQRAEQQKRKHPDCWKRKK